MIGQWHISKNGTAAKCDAEIKCRLGSIHGDTEEEALRLYAQSENLQQFSKMKKKQATPKSEVIMNNIKKHIQASQVKTDKNAKVIKDLRSLKNEIAQTKQMSSSKSMIKNLNFEDMTKIDNKSSSVVRSMRDLRSIKH